MATKKKTEKSVGIMRDPLNLDNANPYVTGRHEYDTRFGDLAKQKNKWQGFAFLLAILCAVLVLKISQMAGQSHVEPFIVEVDPLGSIRSVGAAPRMGEPTQEMMASELMKFIRNMRTVYSDPVAQRDLVTSGYAYVTKGAEDFLNAYFGKKENNPLGLGQKMARMVDVTSVIQDPASKTWRIRWQETEVPVGIGNPTVSEWEGLLEVNRVPPTDEKAALKNPLGIYISALNWTQVSKPKPIELPGGQGRRSEPQYPVLGAPSALPNAPTSMPLQ